jgi:putative transposase
VFTTADVVNLARSQILRSSTEQQFAVIAYCFMCDHLHLLVEGKTDTSDCRRFIARAKQYSAYQHSRQFHERLWQRYTFERVLREQESSATVTRYILENPIRAGLVERVEDYPFLGSFEYTLPHLLEFACGPCEKCLN